MAQGDELGLGEAERSQARRQSLPSTLYSRVKSLPASASEAVLSRISPPDGASGIGRGRLRELLEEELKPKERLRKQVPRSSHAVWKVGEDRQRAMDLLRRQERDRVQDLLPIRHQRMAESPFSFYRGAAVIMADDLSHTPTTNIRVQACGDAHLANFGIFARPSLCRPERDRLPALPQNL